MSPPNPRCEFVGMNGHHPFSVMFDRCRVLWNDATGTLRFLATLLKPKRLQPGPAFVR
jgi:hypothetical protein